ncbi:cyclopropane-fatty-acyl-phospholipid synthase family protein [Sporichthya sp.]|uniref:SAM-dependent methyltransferase n=1 Tax=Sporichthya sp. TaxID=65475 RepID=UPI0017A0C99F|nr:cyclopropane-fatty-acyl-phospholipid synthase family protein [Sporichthya sp.]MBA3744787.1 class I SAM-dependent methyltransferase [Sporichthya sp.]
MRKNAAGQLAGLLEPLFGGTLPIRIRAWDGSEAGPADAPAVLIRNRRALRRLLWSPGELGLAQAYITGELDVEGDLTEGFRLIWSTIRERDLAAPKMQFTSKMRARQIVSAAGTAVRLGAIGPKPPTPASQAKLTGVLHTKLRDRAAISHHYDLSNEFYALLLDNEHLAYSCAYYTSDASDYTLEDAQRDKLDLVCRKLGLVEGSRLLDIGCGWGSLSLHAAEHYGARVIGVTLSREQQDFVLAKVAARGLTDRVEIRLQDYREVPETGFDAVTSIEMGEHVGAENYPTFLGVINGALREGGRALIQQMSRRDRPGGGDFIECYIAPDMHMRPVGETVALIEDAGLEVRDVHAMREHYVWTVRAWLETLEKNWDAVVALVGEEVARVWRLYMVGGALVFEEGRMGVDQILAVKRSAAGASGMPKVRAEAFAIR